MEGDAIVPALDHPLELHQPQSLQQLRPFHPRPRVWSDSKTGQITRYKNRTAARRLIPSKITASITRSRKSCEFALAILAGWIRTRVIRRSQADST